MGCEEAIDRLILYLATERGLSANYQLSTRQSLDSLARWLSRKELALAEVAPRHISEYLAERKRAGLAPASIKAEAVAIRIFFRFLFGRKLLPTNPADKLPTPRIERLLPHTLNEEEVTKMLDGATGEAPLALRDRAILELLYACGLRVSELCNARLEHLDLEEAIIRVTGKGNKTRLVPIGSKAREAIGEYLAKERPALVRPRTGAEVFLSVRGRKLTPQRIWQLMKQYAARAGIDANVYPHIFRHSFATHLLRGGADLRIIQELLGHSNIATTQVYTHVDSSGLKAVHRKFHPRS